MNTRVTRRTGGGAASNRLVVVLSIGLLVTLLVTLLAFANVAKWAANDEIYIIRSEEQRVVSQEIAKSALSAAAGNKAAFAQLREARDKFERIMSELKQGDPAVNLPPSPEPVSAQLREVENAWLELRQNADDILSNRDAILSVQEFISVITEFMPQLQELSEQVVSDLVATNADPVQISIASRQLMLSERIDKNVNKVLAGGQATAAAIDQFSRDSDHLGRVLDGMLEGSESLGIAKITNPGVVQKLREAAMLFSSINDHADEIIETVPAVLPALEAAGQVTSVSDRVNDAALRLVEAYGDSPGLISIMGVKAGPVLIAVLGGLSIAMLISLGYVLLLTARRREV
ncbi:type IV pili methyl-accepting chemotaxis transducer N-terminal domain-containing protein [Sedimenticola selenatireducens]